MSGKAADLDELGLPLVRGVEDIEIVVVKEPSHAELLEIVLSILRSCGCATVQEIKRRLFEDNGGLVVGENTIRKILRELSRRGVVITKPKKGVCLTQLGR